MMTNLVVPTSPMFARVAFIGLGLIGSSLARVLRAEKLAGTIVASSRSDRTLKTAQDIGLIDAGYAEAADAVQQVVRLIRINEYKRQQAAPGVCISRRAYGCDWRYPLASRFVEGAGERQNPSAQPCT